MEMNKDQLSAQLKHPGTVDHSEVKEKILRAVIKWYTRDTTLKCRMELLEWFFKEDMKEATKYQLKVKSQLQEFLPALFESHKDDQTFVDDKNRTPLHLCLSKMDNYWCDKSADYELVTALYDLGASIIALDCDGRSPLGIALNKRRMDLVQVLILSCNVNVAECNDRGQTALHILIDKYDKVIDDYKKHQILVMELLRKGADVNQPDVDGVTAVHLAAKKLDIELLRKFKENGADLEYRTNCGDDLFTIICQSLTASREDLGDALQIIDWMVDSQGLRANVKNKNGFTALHYAAKSATIGIVGTLVRAGVDVRAVADDDTSVLHSAATSSNFEVMQRSIKQNLDYRRRDNIYGFSLLHMAAFSANPRNCEWLVQKKRLHIDDLSKSELTPLHLASVFGNAKVVKKLIELGADVRRTDGKLHRTALHFASLRGQFATLENIVANSDGEIQEHQSSIVADCFHHHRLFDLNATYNATAIALLDAGAEVNARDSLGRTPLHYATRHNIDDGVVSILLKSGAHVDVQDRDRSTPLENCFVNNNYNGLMNLLTFGANINDIARLIDASMDDTVHKMRRFTSVEHEAIKNALKLKKAGLPMEARNKITCIDFGLDQEKYEDDYSLELKKMKKRMLTDEVSLYDVLHMNFKRRSQFANSLPREIRHEFPNYYILVKCRCSEAVNRMALFEAAREAFKWLTGMQWPDICIDNIFSFMSNLSLRLLIDAVSLTE